MMPLGMANVGDVNVIEKITGRDEVRAHLAELGFVVDTSCLCARATRNSSRWSNPPGMAFLYPYIR